MEHSPYNYNLNIPVRDSPLEIQIDLWGSWDAGLIRMESVSLSILRSSLVLYGMFFVCHSPFTLSASNSQQKRRHYGYSNGASLIGHLMITITMQLFHFHQMLRSSYWPCISTVYWVYQQIDSENNVLRILDRKSTSNN